MLTTNDLRRGDIIGIERDDRTHNWITRAIVKYQQQHGLMEPQSQISHVALVTSKDVVIEMVPPRGKIEPLYVNAASTTAHVYRYDFTGKDDLRLQVVDMACYLGNSNYNFMGVVSFYCRFLQPFSVKNAQFCSQLIVNAYRAYHIDLVAEGAENCTPGELCASPLLMYVGHLDI